MVNNHLSLVLKTPHVSTRGTNSTAKTKILVHEKNFSRGYILRHQREKRNPGKIIWYGISVKSVNAMARMKRITANGKLQWKSQIFQVLLQIQNRKRVSTKKQFAVLILGIPTQTYQSQYKIKENVTPKMEIPRRKERWKLRLYLSTRMIPLLTTVWTRNPIPNEIHCLICYRIQIKKWNIIIFRT